jgi:acetyl-CoA carboxylase beta subunit
MVTLFSERNLQECGATMQADASESLKHIVFLVAPFRGGLSASYGNQGLNYLDEGKL